MNSSALFECQAALQRWLMHGDVSVAAHVRMERCDERLRVYADAYRLRLGEVLGGDFPVLRAWIGENAFDALAEDYLRAHPSRHPSVRHFGAAFAGWLRIRKGMAAAAALAEFEWAQGEVFDAADAPVLSMQAVAALPPEAWPELRLCLQPALRLLRVADAVPAMVEAHDAGQPLPERSDDEPAIWLLWRQELEVHWRRLDADEAALLALAREGAAFAALCAQLATPDSSATDAALRVVGLLKRWFADGLIAAVGFQQPNGWSTHPH